MSHSHIHSQHFAATLGERAWVGVFGVILLCVFARTSEAGFCCARIDRPVLNSLIGVESAHTSIHLSYSTDWMLKTLHSTVDKASSSGVNATGRVDAAFFLRRPTQGSNQTPTQDHGQVPVPLVMVSSCGSPTSSENESRRVSGSILFCMIAGAPVTGLNGWSRPVEHLFLIFDVQSELLRPPITAS